MVEATSSPTNREEGLTTMQTKTKTGAGSAGGYAGMNHDQNQGLRVKTSVKAGLGGGFIAANHNQSLRVKTSIKAGLGGGFTQVNHNQTHGGSCKSGS